MADNEQPTTPNAEPANRGAEEALQASPAAAPAPAQTPAPEAPASDFAGGVSSAGRFRDRATKREEGELLTLSSGETVKVRRPSITNMVKAQIVPANVAGAALKFDSGKPMSDRDVQRLFELKEIVTRAALLSPKIVKEPNYDHDEISFDDLTEDEINDVYMYVQVGLEELTKFREKRQRDASGPDSDTVPGDQA